MKNRETGKKPKNKTVLLLAALAMLALLVGFSPLQKQNPISPEPFSPEDNKGIDNCVDLDRSSYGMPSAVFEELPKPPQCFFSIVNAYREQKFSVLGVVPRFFGHND